MSKEIKKKKKVFVAMSGGVDSSVAAALLKKATLNNFEKLFGRPTPEGFRGYDVTGVFMKAWYPDFLTCTWPEDRLDAMRVCAKLSIPFLTFDFEKEYKKNVVDYMVFEYKAGRTPNPDVMCNKNIKFGAFLKKSKELGADFIATGHYARIATSHWGVGTSKKGKAKNSLNPSGYTLMTAQDAQKDQTYFLWTLTQDVLKRTLFPIGEYTKPKVRKLAKKFDLPTAEKKDSQGLCFLGKIDMKEFLKNYIPEKKGDVLNENNEIIGHHDGVMFYTIGQRHGFVITKQQPDELPHYIVSKDIKKNTLIVSTDLHHNLSNTKCPTLSVGQQAVQIQLERVNWIEGIPPTLNKKLTARTRYRQKLHPCRVEKAENDHTTIIFTKEQPLAPPGQSLVLYDSEKCLGGGIII